LGRFIPLLAVSMLFTYHANAAPPAPLVSGLKNPESVAVSQGGRIFISAIGEFDKDGDGAIVELKNGKVAPFVENLNDPKGLAAFQQWLFVTDKDRVLRIELKTGKSTVLAEGKAFPTQPKFLNDVMVLEGEAGLDGTVFVSDSGDSKGGGGAIYRIDRKGKVSVVSDEKKTPALKGPNGLALDSIYHLLLLDAGSGELHRIRTTDGKSERVADGLGVGDGVVIDHHGRVFLSDWQGGKVFGIPRPGEKPVLVADGFQSAADLCYDAPRKRILVPDMKAGTLHALPAQIPGWEVDETPLPLQIDVAFPNLKWTGWDADSGTGKIVPLRPIVLTHAGDGSNRTFVATQHGVIHVFPNDQQAKETKVFLDIQSKVRYRDETNEEGFLGMAFHPKYKQNGEFFVFYTDRKAKLTNVVSRFRVSKDDPDRADPGSEEELLRVPHPFWNHDGGTVCFGPDGYLYIVLGDGGAANDPFDNGQKLGTQLGKILRIDVDGNGEGKPYAIPKDNPFVDTKGAMPEIFALGVRNPWRLVFDRKTGAGWFGEVGQNLWEEINLLERGGNYGWRRRESLHPFWTDGTGPRKEFIEPIWEYHHDIGKSITGGHVYRGKQFPELDGQYLYADYVTNKVWALQYDEGKKRIVSNRPIKDRNVPILSFGEDEMGEVYLLTYTPTGRGVLRIARTEAK
jgi:glucose/arabinose dehydrogenase/sugar lactone lactonase YvrE